MTRTGNRVIVVVLVGVGLLAVAVVPFLVVPALVAGSLVLAVRLRTTHPGFSRAWTLAGLSVGLLAAAIGVSIFMAPQLAVTVLLLLGFIAYTGTIILFGQAWSRRSDHPKAAWVTAVSGGLIGLLSVVLMGAFGRGIALADAGQSSWLVNTLLLISAIGIPTLFLVGLIAFSRTRQEEHPNPLVQ
jgi:hypothetical protein